MVQDSGKVIPDFDAAAVERFEDAEVLWGHGRVRGAVYLAGSAVEFILKAIVLDGLLREDQLDRLETFKKKKGHNYDSLREFLRKKRVTIPEPIGRRLANINAWTVEWRYQTGELDGIDARDFLDDVAAIMKWARKELGHGDLDEA